MFLSTLLIFSLSLQLPFRGGNDYQTFKKIQSLDYTIPQGFPETARVSGSP